MRMALILALAAACGGTQSGVSFRAPQMVDGASLIAAPPGASSPAFQIVSLHNLNSIFVVAPCRPGDSFELTAVARWVAGSGDGGKADLAVSFQDDQGSFIGGSFVASTSSTEWTDVWTGPVVAPPGAAHVVLALCSEATPGVNTSIAQFASVDVVQGHAAH